MMAGNPNWWSMKNMHPQSKQQYSTGFFSSPSAYSSLFSPDPEHSSGSSSSSLPSSLLADHDHNNQDFPQSWSQLRLGGLVAEEERFGTSSNFHSEKLENWRDEQELNPSLRIPAVIDVKQKVTQSCCQLFVHGDIVDETQAHSCKPAYWSSPVMPAVSSPRSSATSLSSNILDFSSIKSDEKHQVLLDHSSERNNTATGGVYKKARVNSSSNQLPQKVRKVGDRITALHQLVSPFGKTDTASVLFETTGYIRFLQGQIKALSSPYLGCSLSANTKYQRSAQEERNCVFFEENSQLLNDSCLKRRGAAVQDIQDQPKDLRSRGLCLVPVSCTNHVNMRNYDNIGADYWAPFFGGGF